MAGLIRREDIDEVRARTDIKEIVDGYVTLKSAGIGSWKGLCPFHDERTPSFHVRPQMGTYHCFGCDESGDVISFLMTMDHTTFSETVEKLAARVGYELHYEQGSGPNKEEVGRRQRLLDAHKVAAEFFQRNLYTRQAAPAQQFLGERGFDGEAARRYGVGYAPRGWDHLLKHLRERGFTDQELKLTGMFSEGNRGLYDRFRGRLVWPIRAVAGEVIGFGARKLHDDDQGPKYLNTPETALYKKSQVLYGIDLAKREIARQRRLVVVEGYTDVMACHLAGVTTAVATCGTAFGAEHIKIVRRFLSDDGGGGEVVFTFDGDAAGQKAALRAFEEDQKFVAQTYVAVEPHGMDPCDLRLARGDAAVAELVENRRPLFEFAIRATLKNFDLDTIEGRIRAMRACAPIVARIRDRSLRPAYARQLAGWLGLEPAEVQRAVDAAGRAQREEAPAPHRPAEPEASGPAPVELPDPREPVARMEREALETVIQCPDLMLARHWEEFGLSDFRYPVHGAVHDAVLAARAELLGDGSAVPSGQAWVDGVRGHLPEPLHGYLAELAVTPLPATTQQQLERYTADILNRLFELQINRRKSDRLAELQRTDPTGQRERYQELQRELLELEMQRRGLRQD
ncbi:DNA primase [Kocuria rosea]|uniref:DNA primase n=1 Tax=Kocuria TaxID=57493 RepID=UPI000BAB4A90|nr:MULTISPECIES: DNA primase [Kocuria]NVC24794.1 DNA primase [Kocuria salina]MEB2527494.1 DNA primase [Kocuria rosea]MEB2617294.1 DNA primase [Kocuria rosea]PAU89961.1 DNA primase [Kocuria sp. WN036]PWF85973.1 DNA primase [Kocuria rosea]